MNQARSIGKLHLQPQPSGGGGMRWRRRCAASTVLNHPLGCWLCAAGGEAFPISPIFFSFLFFRKGVPHTFRKGVSWTSPRFDLGTGLCCGESCTGAGSRRCRFLHLSSFSVMVFPFLLCQSCFCRDRSGGGTLCCGGVVWCGVPRRQPGRAALLA